MKIAGYLKTSLLDWPGKVSGVIFTAGCNFRCPFCHNRDLVIVSDNLEYIDEKALLNDLKKRKIWIDGLVITGGEPTLQPDLIEFCQKVKKLGIGVKLDTNGSNPEVVKKLIKEKLVDFFAMDVKTEANSYQRTACLAESRRANSQEENSKLIARIKKSIKLITGSGLEFELRTTVVPGIHDQECLMRMGREIKRMAVRLRPDLNRDYVEINEAKWTWQNFVGRNCLDEAFNGKIGYSKRVIAGWKKEVEKTGVKIILRGW